MKVIGGGCVLLGLSLLLLALAFGEMIGDPLSHNAEERSRMLQTSRYRAISLLACASVSGALAIRMMLLGRKL
jgi:hypothetical protein